MAQSILNSLYQSLNDWLQGATTPKSPDSKNIKYCLGEPVLA